MDVRRRAAPGDACCSGSLFPLRALLLDVQKQFGLSHTGAGCKHFLATPRKAGERNHLASNGLVKASKVSPRDAKLMKATHHMLESRLGRQATPASGWDSKSRSGPEEGWGVVREVGPERLWGNQNHTD